MADLGVRPLYSDSPKQLAREFIVVNHDWVSRINGVGLPVDKDTFIGIDDTKRCGWRPMRKLVMVDF